MARYQQGIFTPKNPEKYRGNVTNIVYRSGWEKQFMLYCDRSSSIISWSSEEVVIPYRSPLDGILHRYFVDFHIEVKTPTGIKKYLVEIKPKKETQPPAPPKTRKGQERYVNEAQTFMVNQAKWKSADSYAKQRGMEFMVLTEDHLFGK